MTKRNKTKVKKKKSSKMKKAKPMDLFALPNPPSIEGMLSDMFGDA